jgi:hypothetical protein
VLKCLETAADTLRFIESRSSLSAKSAYGDRIDVHPLQIDGGGALSGKARGELD